MDFVRRHAARRILIILFSLFPLTLVVRQHNASQRFLAPGDLSRSLVVVDSCPLNSAATLNGPNPSEAAGRRGIPNVIHQIWKTRDVSTYVTEGGPSQQEWKTKFEPLNYTIKLWTDDDIHQLIAARYAWLLPTFDGYGHNIQRADIARLAVVHAEGGIYADLDVYPRDAAYTRCLQRLGLQAILVPTRTGGLGLSNHFFMAEQGSPFLLWALWEAKRRSVSASFRVLLPYLHVLWSTGPLMVTAAARSYVWIYGDATKRLNIGVLDEVKFRRDILGHATGRSWHGTDGMVLNYIADHASRVVFMVFLTLLFLLAAILMLQRLRFAGRRHDIARAKQSHNYK